MDDERLANLETTVAFQDRLIGELNGELVRQQGRIERLEEQVRELLERGLPVGDAEDEPPPPHY